MVANRDINAQRASAWERQAWTIFARCGLGFLDLRQNGSKNVQRRLVNKPKVQVGVLGDEFLRDSYSVNVYMGDVISTRGKTGKVLAYLLN
jgi:hypothetical protein